MIILRFIKDALKTEGIVSLTKKIRHKVTMVCGRCIKEHNKLAYFSADSNMYDNSLLCRKCFMVAFNLQTNQQKKQWRFYGQMDKG